MRTPVRCRWQTPRTRSNTKKKRTVLMTALSVSLSNALTALPAGDPALPALSECVQRAMRGYLQRAGVDVAGGLYQLVLDEVEAPLLREVLRHTEGNLSRAAELLGISRATLRKKLAVHAIGG